MYFKVIMNINHCSLQNVCFATYYFQNTIYEKQFVTGEVLHKPKSHCTPLLVL